MMRRRASQFKMASLMLIGLLILQTLPAWSEHDQHDKLESQVPNCSIQDDSNAQFRPRAYTLTPMYVRVKVPEYSIVRGKWILGEVQGILKANTCLQILERRAIGVIQMWYWIRYLDEARQVRTGWVWGGTKNKDEGNYIGGDVEPPAASILYPEKPVLGAWSLISEASAQGDILPPPLDSTNYSVPSAPPGGEGGDMDYLVELPVLGQFSVGTISAVVLFLFMLCGMIAKAVWDQTDQGEKLTPPKEKIIRPLLVSPIAFSAFWGPMYVQQGGSGLSLTMVLYAFQIGFMWQHVLEKKAVSGGGK